jgi:membrane protein implicated in regulation of membrane protease activity
VFGVLTFRTVMIGLTFFGLTGKASMASGFGPPRALMVAIVCGLVAMYGVYFLMRGLYKLTADGTERIDRAIGEEGTVYLTIPGRNEGLGKVQVAVQNRTVEYEAMTGGEKLPTGARIVVVGVLGAGRVEVEPVIEPARNSNV